MRTLRFLALGAIFACGLIASQASAVPSVTISYVGGSSAGSPVGDTIMANTSDVLTFDIAVLADSAGIGAMGIDILWTDADVAQTSANWETGTIITSFTPFTSADYSMPMAPIVGPDIDPNGVLISNIGFFGLPPAPSSTNVFLGTITFHIGSAASTLIQTGFFRTDGSSSSNEVGTFVTPNFSSFTITTPAPGATLSLAAGLVTLALVTMRRRK